MEAVIVVLLVVVIGAVLFFMWEGRESRRTLEGKLDSQRVEMTSQWEAQRSDVNARLDAVQNTVGQSLSGSSQTLQHVVERLTGIDSATKRILEEVGPGITALQDILRPPTLRGGFGETLLQQLLGNVLPSHHFQLQYSFRSGEMVDAVIRIPEGLVPVDSKFPLEGFQRMLAARSNEDRERERRAFVQTVKKHVDSVTKYILPDEGTLTFALMYIPSESVYYEVMVRDEISEAAGSLPEYARTKNIFPVSPNTLYGLLQAIARGLRGLQVEERAREIIDHLSRLQGDFGNIRQDFDTLGRHLEHAKGKYDDLDRRVVRFEDRLARPVEGPAPQTLPEPTAVSGGEEAG